MENLQLTVSKNMMSTLKGTFCVLFCLLCLTSFSQSKPDDILNARWKCDDGKSIIEFNKAKDGTYTSKLVWLSVSKDKNGNPVTDRNNSDKALRNRPLLGMVYSKDIKFKDGKWFTEYLYSPEHGMVATGEIWLERKDVLKIKGKKFLITKTQSFTRVK